MFRRHVWPWGRRLAGAGISQGLVQFIAMVSGVLIIRLLKPESYALYSLSYSAVSMMSVVADSGISAGALAEAGKIWEDPLRLGEVIATILDLRRKAAVWVVVLSAPAMMYLLHFHGASWVETLALTALVIVQFGLALQIAVYGLAPALHQWIGKTQRIALVQNAARAASVATVLVCVPSAEMAMLAGLPAQFWNLLALKRLTKSLIVPAARTDPAVRARVLKVVARIMPGAIYYALSGQITIWLISVFGNTTTLANVGALGRLAQLLTVISSAFSLVFTPRFARFQADKPRVLLRYLQILGLATAAGLCVLGFVLIFTRQTLWVLGKNYSGLEHEVRLQALLGVLLLIAGLAIQLGSVRAVVIKPYISIPVEIGLQLSVIRWISFSTAAGVLHFAIITAGLQLAMHVLYFVYVTSRVSSDQVSAL